MLLCAVIAAGSAYVVNKRQAISYRAITLLIVEQRALTGGDAYSNVLASDQLVQTYLNLIKTPPVLERAARQVGGISGAELATRVRVANPGTNTQIIQVQVDDRDPRRAARLANAIATSFITIQQQSAANGFNAVWQQIDEKLAALTDQYRAMSNRIFAIEAGNKHDPRLDVLNGQRDAISSAHAALISAAAQVFAPLIETKVHVFQAALPPTTPAGPNVRLTAAAAGLAGLVLAAGVVLLLEYLDDRLRTAADVEEATGLTTIGTVASQHKDRDLLAAQNTARLAASFRTLSRNLSFASLDRPLASIVVTSAMPGEGKTMVAINLAMSLALSGRRVLLVDADLRHPAVHNRLGLTNVSGLTLHLLKGDQDLGEALPLVTLPAVPNLLVLTAGPVPPNPTEMLGSVRMQRFLESVRSGERQSEQVDVVVLDTPAAAGFADAAVLAALASCTVLVVDAKRCREGQLMLALDALRHVNARIVGVVLNHAAQQGEEVDYYQYVRRYERADAAETLPAVPTDT